MPRAEMGLAEIGDAIEALVEAEVERRLLTQTPNPRAVILEAQRLRVCVAFTYHPNGVATDSSQRLIAPYDLEDENQTVLGWDHYRHGMRRFKLDNMHDLRLAPTPVVDEEEVAGE
jgi:predicted DNA-binding transcriptional regulator YafY